MKPRPRLPIPKNQPEEHRYHVAMQQSMADMDADPPTTTTAALAPEVRERIARLLRALNDEFAAEARDSRARLELRKPVRRMLGYDRKDNAIAKIKKTLIKGTTQKLKSLQAAGISEVEIPAGRRDFRS